MSTRASIKWRAQEGTVPGYHLYDDLTDGLDGTPQEETPVYLALGGVVIADLGTHENGTDVTIQMPREMARALGLLRRRG